MIFVTHGVVKSKHPEKFTHRNFLDWNKFESYLDSRKTRFITIDEALEGKGDAITIDDSSYGALDAAILCRKYDHKVTIFINPYYTEKMKNYWFFLLNCILDSEKNIKCTFKERDFNLTTYEEKLVFRITLKEYISKLYSEDDRYDFLKKCLNCKDLEKLDVPKHLKTLDRYNLIYAQNSGVILHNHGYTHVQISDYDLVQPREEINKGYNWIQENLNFESKYYAVPFGRSLPPSKFKFEKLKMWFLAYSKLYGGQIGEKIYNRQTLIL